MTDLFTSDLSLWGLFISSLLGATLLPGGSELVLVGVLKLHPELLWPAIAIATLGNTLGGLITFGMGYLLPQRQGGSKAAGHPTAYSSRVQRQQLKHVEKLQRYGTPALLLAWLPIIGDALCLTAGWLRLNVWRVALFMALGKFIRYLIIGMAM